MGGDLSCRSVVKASGGGSIGEGQRQIIGDGLDETNERLEKNGRETL